MQSQKPVSEAVLMGMSAIAGKSYGFAGYRARGRGGRHATRWGTSPSRKAHKQARTRRRAGNPVRTTTRISREKNGGINLALQVLQMSQAEWRAEVFAQVQPVLFGNGHKDVDDLGVKLATRAAFDLFAGMRHR